MKYAFVVAGVVMALGLGYLVWTKYGSAMLSGNLEPQEVAPTILTYASSTFSISHPDNFGVDETYAYSQFEGKPILGVKFTVSTVATQGTNLSADSGLSVEMLPRAIRCTGDIYLPANVKAMSMTMGSTTFSVASSTGAAAGNMYEEQVYAISESKPCIAVRYFIHSSNIANYDPGTVAEFDRAALLSEFDAMRDSLILKQ